jgi:toxic protein SymE
MSGDVSFFYNTLKLNILSDICKFYYRNLGVTLRVEEPRVRYLKLQPFYRQSQRDYGYKTVPELRLCGNWLEEVGFSPEKYISVTVMDGLLVIRSTITVEKDD